MSENLDIIQPKSDEHIYAQTAAYVHEQPHDRELGRDIGGVATAFVSGESVITTGEGSDKQETEHTSEDYVSFLRAASPETRSDIGFLTDKMRAYADFKEDIDDILADSSEDDEHYLGKGSAGMAFKLQRDDQDYAVKRGGVSFGDIRAFNRAKDIDGVSHLVAMDLDAKRSVMNLVPGTLATQLTNADRVAIPEVHVQGVIEKAVELYDAGVRIDPKPSNFLYDQEKGFGIIDYQVLEEKDTLADQVAGTSRMLIIRSNNLDIPADGTPEYAAYEHRNAEADSIILNKYLNVLESKYPDILEQMAKRQADNIADPSIGSGSLFYPYALPTDTPQLAAFKDRLDTLGLLGEEYVAKEYDDEADEDGVW